MAGAFFGCGMKEMPPGFPMLPDKRIECIYCERAEHAIGVRQRRSANNCNRWRILRELARESFDAFRLHSGALCNFCGSILGQPGHEFPLPQF